MFPHEELTDLEQRKALLQARIALGRLQCRTAAVELARPLALVDRGLEFWRRVSPFAKVLALPAGFMLTRFLRRGRPRSGGGGRGKLAALTSLLPLVLRGARIALAVRSAYARAKSSPPSASAPGARNDSRR